MVFSTCPRNRAAASGSLDRHPINGEPEMQGVLLPLAADVGESIAIVAANALQERCQPLHGGSGSQLMLD